MNSVSSVSFRIDTELKNQADALFQALGLNMTTAFNMFLRQCVREGRIPFEATINVPNGKTVAALLESIRLANDSSTKAHDVETAIKKLKS